MKKTNKIILLFNCPFVEGFVHKYCLEEIIELGYSLTIADLSNVLEKKYSNKTTANLAVTKDFEIIKFNTYKGIAKFIKENKEKALFLPMFDFIYPARRIFYLFTKYKVHYGYVNNLLPSLFTPGENAGIVIKKDKFNLQHLKAAMFHRIWRKILPYRRADFMFFSSNNGEKFLLSEGACGKKTKKFYLYSFEYENFMKTPGYENDKKYGVFIDQYIPYHPDNTVHANIHIDPQKYFKELDEILTTIKKLYNIEIIIAAHPQANYSENKYLNKYKIEYGKTAELVKNSELVCTHFSTAVVFAVMAQKKLILINNDTLRPYEKFQDGINFIEKKIGCPVYHNAEEILQQNVLCRMNTDNSLDFMKLFIASVDKNELYLWERVFNNIFEV